MSTSSEPLPGGFVSRRNGWLLATLVVALSLVWTILLKREAVTSDPKPSGAPGVAVSDTVSEDGSGERSSAASVSAAAQGGDAQETQVRGAVWTLDVLSSWEESGLPGAGVHIWLTSAERRGTGPLAPHVFVQECDFDSAGRARLEGLPFRDDLLLETAYSDPARLTPPAEGTEKELVLTLRGGRPVLVQVTDPRENPIADATVYGVYARGSSFWQWKEIPLGTTDGSGTLRLGGMSRFDALTAHADGYVRSDPVPLVRDAGNAERRIRIVLEPGGHSFRIRVQTQDHNLVPGAEVVLRRAPGSDRSAPELQGLPILTVLGRAVSDDEGRCTFRSCPPEPIEVYAFHPEAGSWSGPVPGPVQPGEEVVVTLRAHGVLSGRATGSGAPATNCTVWVLDHMMRFRKVRASEDGSFEISGLSAGPAQARAADPTLGRAETSDIYIASDGRTVWNPELRSEGRLGGWVLDEDRNPIAQAQVQAIPTRAPPNESIGTWIRQDISDVRGAWNVLDCLPVPHVLEVRMPPYTSELPVAFLEDVQPDRSDIVIVVTSNPRRGRIEGKLVGLESLGGEGVSLLTARRGSYRQRSWPIDPRDSSFSAGPLLPGEYVLALLVRNTRYPLNLTVEVSPRRTTNLGRVPVPAACEVVLELSLVDDGSLSMPIDVFLESESDPQLVRWSEADADAQSQVVFDLVPPGEYFVRTDAGAWYAGTPLRLQPGEHRRVHLSLASPGTHTLELVRHSGAQIEPPYRLRILDAEDRITSAYWVSIAPDEPTPVTLSAPPGLYRVELLQDGLRVAERLLEFTGGGAGDTDVRWEF